MRKKPCKIHGILSSENITSQDRCRLCRNEWAADWKSKNRERVNATNARSRQRNPEMWEKSYKKDYQTKKSRIGSVLLTTQEITRRRGISIEEYEILFERQQHKCAVCNKEETRKGRSGKIARLTLDHNHVTNKVRELLCHDCNTAIGKFKENLQIMQSAIKYLQDFGGNK